MRHRNKTHLLLLQSMVWGVLIGSSLASIDALGQDGQSSGDRRSESDERRESWSQWRRDREERRRERSDSRDTSSDRSTEERRPVSQPGMNMTDYAKGLITQYDKNGNKVLDADEQGQLKEPAASADLNKDGVIIREELVAHLSGSSRVTSTAGRKADPDGKSTSTGSRSGGGTAKRVFTGTAGGVQTADAEKTPRRSYRFKPALDRLPTGVPSWFKSRDKNGDGQVAMSEYSRSWSSRLVAEFRRYDANDDGIITPKEAAK